MTLAARVVSTSASILLMIINTLNEVPTLRLQSSALQEGEESLQLFWKMSFTKSGTFCRALKHHSLNVLHR